MIDWGQFHFLRPGALLLLLPTALIAFSILRRQDPLRGWKRIISPELLEHLALQQQNQAGKLRPVYTLVAAWSLGVLALAGPAWQREVTPFTQDQAALFIVMKVTPEMLAEDIQPNRLQRAAQKVSDLLEIRPGSKTGLIAYAGSAHLVMPLTSDPGIIRFFASELDPTVMPVAGDEPQQALELAQRRLQESGLAGSIVLITDSVALPISAGGNADVHILAMAAGPEVLPPPGGPPAPALDAVTMDQAGRALGAGWVQVSPDDADVRQLDRAIERSIATAPAQEGERWKDSGYFLMFGVVLLVLPLFRGGGAVRIET